VIVAWAPLAASAGVPAAVAGCSSARSRVRFQTVTSNPARCRFAAIREPMIPSPRNANLLGVRASRILELLSMSASSRCLDPQPPARPQDAGRLRRRLLAVDQVPARLARRSARGARRCVAAALGDQRVAHLRERLELADDAVAAAKG